MFSASPIGLHSESFSNKTKFAVSVHLWLDVETKLWQVNLCVPSFAILYYLQWSGGLQTRSIAVTQPHFLLYQAETVSPRKPISQVKVHLVGHKSQLACSPQELGLVWRRVRFGYLYSENKMAQQHSDHIVGHIKYLCNQQTHKKESKSTNYNSTEVNKQMKRAKENKTDGKTPEQYLDVFWDGTVVQPDNEIWLYLKGI